MVLHNTTISPQTIFLKSNEYTSLNNGSLKSDINYELKNKILIPSNVDCYIQLNTFKFINSFYNINGSNNHFYYSVHHSGIYETIDITIPYGNYSITSILEYLNTATAVHHMDFIYLDTLFKINITSSGSHEFFLINGVNNCLKVLGFNSAITATYVTTLISPDLINLSGTQCLYISLENVNLSSNSCKQSQNNNIIENINVDVLIGSSQSYTNTNNSKFRVNENFISYVNVKIYNESGILVDFNNTDYYLSLGLIFAYKMTYQAPQILDLNNNGIDDRLENANANENNNNNENGNENNV